jgi:hypothetical protein
MTISQTERKPRRRPIEKMKKHQPVKRIPKSKPVCQTTLMFLGGTHEKE